MLQFVLGRAGSGKTEYLRELLAEKNRQGGEKLMMLVPEQYSFETEKAILHKAGPVRAATIQVYSFTRLAEANDGTVETVRLSPRERCAGLEAQFLVLDLKPGDLPGFFRVLQYSTGLCLDAKTTGEVCMSMTIPDVFIKRSEASLPVAEFDEGEF